MLSPHPADPTLTTDNIMEVVKEVEHQWEEFGKSLMPASIHKIAAIRIESIKGLYKTDHLRMEAVVDYFVKYHYDSSWKRVAAALQRMGLHKLADEVTTKYVRGMDVNRVPC